MQRRVFLLLGLLLAMPVLAQANTISLVGSGSLLPNTPGQVITLQLTGADFYSDGNFASTIAAGGPKVELVFNDPAGSIPAGNLVGSIWAGGLAGIAGNPNGTTADSTGQATGASFGTSGFASQNTNGTYITLSLTTVGSLPGVYNLDLTGTDMFNGLDEETFEPIPSPLDFGQIQLTIVPEPSSIVIGLFAAAGMAAVVIRRRRAA